MANSSSDLSYPQLAARPVGQKISDLYRQRIGLLTAPGQYEEENLLALVFPEEHA
jgi:alpha-mannosidase